MIIRCSYFTLMQIKVAARQRKKKKKEKNNLKTYIHENNKKNGVKN